MSIHAVESSRNADPTWPNKPSADNGVPGVYVAQNNLGGPGCTNGHLVTDLTGMVRAWADGRPSNGIRLMASSETQSSYERRFCSGNPSSAHSICNNAGGVPQLHVTYSDEAADADSAAEAIADATPDPFQGNEFADGNPNPQPTVESAAWAINCVSGEAEWDTFERWPDNAGRIVPIRCGYWNGTKVGESENCARSTAGIRGTEERSERRWKIRIIRGCRIPPLRYTSANISGTAILFIGSGWSPIFAGPERPTCRASLLRTRSG